MTKKPNPLVDKLKPSTKQRIGKAAPCPKCGSEAEHYSANYIACPRCDKPKAGIAAPPPDATVPGDFELEETTQPQWSNWRILNPDREYVCVKCGTRQMANPQLVAHGQSCVVCPGMLLVVP